jgi:4-amino-4-deoxy-L-arabinose transferase-like glycosyltransferase
MPVVLTWARRATLGYIMAAALVLRLTGVTTDYPWYWYPDRDVPVHARECINLAHPRLDPGEYIYPTGYIYLNAAVYAVVGAVAVVTGAVHGLHGLAALYYGKFGFLMAVTRIVGTLVSLAAIWLVARLTRKVAGELAGTLAAAALAFAWLDVVCCHYPTTDVASGFVLLATAMFALRLYGRRAGAKDYVIGGLLAGAAAATKYPAGAGLVSLLLAHWFARKREREEGDAEAAQERPGAWAGAGMLVGATVVGFLVLCPWAVLNWPTFLADMIYQSVYNKCGPEAPWQVARFLFGMTPAAGMGWPLNLVALVGLGWLVVNKRRETAVLLAGAVLVFLSYASTTRFFERWYETLMPFVAMGVGIGVAWMAGRVLRRTRAAAVILGSLALAAMLAKPVAYEAWYDWILTQTGSRRVATAYLGRHIPPGSVVAQGQWAWAGPDLPAQRYKVRWMIAGSPERLYAGLRLKGLMEGRFGEKLKVISPSSYGALKAREKELLLAGEDLKALLPRIPADADWVIVNTEAARRAVESAPREFAPAPGMRYPSYQAMLRGAYNEIFRELGARQVSQLQISGGHREHHPWGTWPYGSPNLLIFQLRPVAAPGGTAGSSGGATK